MLQHFFRYGYSIKATVIMFGQKSKRRSVKKKKGGNQAAPGPSSTVEAVQQMRANITTVEKRVKFLNTQSLNLKAQAKNAVKSGDKATALLKLQKKKILDQQISNLSASLLQLESQKFDLENSSTTMEIVSTMAMGAKAQKDIAKRMDPDKVQSLMDDLDDLKEQNAEVNDILGVFSEDLTADGELEAELEAMMLEEEESRITIPSVPNSKVGASNDEFDELLASLADAPTGKVAVPAPQKTDAEAEDELAELAAQML